MICVAVSDGKDGAEHHLERGGFRLRSSPRRLLPHPGVHPPHGSKRRRRSADSVAQRAWDPGAASSVRDRCDVARCAESRVDAQYCPAARCRGTEWAPIAGVGGDVLLALPVIAGDEIKSVVAWRTGSTIMVAEGLLRTCSGGECAAPLQAMYLAAIPRVALPLGIVTFQVAGEPSRSAVNLPVGAATPASQSHPRPPDADSPARCRVLRAPGAAKLVLISKPADSIDVE